MRILVCLVLMGVALGAPVADEAPADIPETKPSPPDAPAPELPTALPPTTEFPKEEPLATPEPEPFDEKAALHLQQELNLFAFFGEIDDSEYALLASAPLALESTPFALESLEPRAEPQPNLSGEAVFKKGAD